MIESQASILECSKPIINDVGSALGMIIKSNDTDIIVLPGVPSEMKAMLKKVEFNLFKGTRKNLIKKQEKKSKKKQITLINNKALF